ncbi:PEP-CTERM sorting domain-containing protein [Roseiconus nitratireducens]|nr:PEP-CTERM sorting domain-containing protein [Roseiconus nitratireducens]
MMNNKRVICAATMAALMTCCQAQAAVVSFLGSVDSGRPGPVLGSLPRNFVLVLDYTPSPGGSSNTTGTLSFPATPNSNTSNTDPNPAVSVMTIGQVAIGNNTGAGGTDFFSFNGNVPTGMLGPNQVNFSFTFTKPGDTLDSNELTPEAIATLVSGQTSVAFSGGTGGFSGQGVIRGAPEPSTMIALTGLVVGGCGIGYRRRKQSRSEDSEAISE